MKFPWGHSRRFNAYSEYFKKVFGGRIQKLSVDAGFTCPNRDGKVSVGGCTYCDNNAFNPSYCDPVKPIITQIEEGIEFHRKRYRRAERFLAYFQPYSNTYVPLPHLKNVYEEALSHRSVAGLVIGTRPDCMDEDKLEYFSDLSKKCYLIIEYGLESVYEKTLSRINRGHTCKLTEKMIHKTARSGINTGAHVIFGLPGETRQDMLKEAGIISKLPLTTIKLHQLQIINDTSIAEEFRNNPGEFVKFTLPQYIDFIIEFIELLDPGIVIERFAGEVPPRFLAEPSWGLIRNDQILAMIEKELKRRDSWQGKFFGK